ncbi:MAG: hypothetical protein ACTHJH_16590 [Marmoricola sp.]
MTARTGRWGRALLVAPVLLAAGCGGGNPLSGLLGQDNTPASYCAALNADRRAFADMLAADSPTALVQQVPMLSALAAAAPPDLSDEWQVFLGAVKGLQRALDRAGVRPSAFADGKPPKGVTPAQDALVRRAADALSAPDTVAAAQGIEQEARDVCKINLGT